MQIMYIRGHRNENGAGFYRAILRFARTTTASLFVQATGRCIDTENRESGRIRQPQRTRFCTAHREQAIAQSRFSVPLWRRRARLLPVIPDPYTLQAALMCHSWHLYHLLTKPPTDASVSHPSSEIQTESALEKVSLPNDVGIEMLDRLEQLDGTRVRIRMTVEGVLKRMCSRRR